jgi:hypothetical protein
VTLLGQGMDSPDETDAISTPPIGQTMPVDGVGIFKI